MWLVYFLIVIGEVFKAAKEETMSFYGKGKGHSGPVPEDMDPRARVIPGHFVQEDRISAPPGGQGAGVFRPNGPTSAGRLGEGWDADRSESVEPKKGQWIMGKISVNFRQ